MGHPNPKMPLGPVAVLYTAEEMDHPLLWPGKASPFHCELWTVAPCEQGRKRCQFNS